LRSLQEIQPDFEEEAKAYAGLWSQGKKKKKNLATNSKEMTRYSLKQFVISSSFVIHRK
jgi:hypothetical protein